MLKRTLLKTRLFHVEHRRYPRDDGNPIERDVVVHPGAVVILPLLDDRRIILIRNYRHAVESDLWELPAGTREPGEPPIETAARELIEETGYQAGRVEPLTEFYMSPGILTERMHAYLAMDLTWVGQALEEGEHIQPEIVGVAQVKRMLRAGEFQDAKTLATLGFFFLRTRR